MTSHLPGLIPVTILGLILLFVPGVIGLDLYFRRAQSNVPITRSQRLVYSTVISIASIGFLYLTSQLLLWSITPTAVFISQSLHLVTFEELLNLRTSELVSLYLIHFAVTISVGYFIGVLVLRRAEGPRDRREPWRYAFEMVPRQGEMIEVITNDGTIVHGEFNRAAWDRNKRELFLDNPYEIHYTMAGDEILHSNDLGRSILIPAGSLVRINFLEEDPQVDKEGTISEAIQQEIFDLESASGQTSIDIDEWVEKREEEIEEDGEAIFAEGQNEPLEES